MTMNYFEPDYTVQPAVRCVQLIDLPYYKSFKVELLQSDTAVRARKYQHKGT